MRRPRLRENRNRNGRDAVPHLRTERLAVEEVNDWMPNGGHRRIVMAVTNDVVTDRRVARHAATLAEAGYDVVVVGREVWGAESGERSVGGGQWGVERLRLRNRRGWRFYAEMNWKLARWVPKQKPDIVWANDSDTLPGCYVAARMAGARLVMDAHELFPEVPEILHKPLVRWVWRTVERWLMPRCDARLTVCQSIADHYQRTLGVEMAVVRNISSGEWRAENGERRTESGERRAENGERRAENRERRAENGERRTENEEILNSQFPKCFSIKGP